MIHSAKKIKIMLDRVFRDFLTLDERGLIALVACLSPSIFHHEALIYNKEQGTVM